MKIPMVKSLREHGEPPWPTRPRHTDVRLVVAVLLLCGSLCGCAAMTNPVSRGMGVHEVPPELLAQSKEGREPIPLLYLRQQPPEAYLLAPGDVLGVVIEGVLGDSGQAPPVNIDPSGKLAPSMGYPVPVREDGTVAIPLVKPLLVQGMTVPQAERAIVEAYTVTTKVLPADRARIMVTLTRPRETRVLVIREDSAVGQLGVQTTGGVSSSLVGGGVQMTGGFRRGTGETVSLPAYENDVLGALTRTGGLPGLDAANEIIIQRGSPSRRHDLAGRTAMGRPDTFEQRGLPGLGVPLQGATSPIETVPAPLPQSLASGQLEQGAEIIRIPLSIRRGEPLPFKPEEIILRAGDIVSIPARDTEVFYTAGLLGSGEHPLPRDYDLDVVKAISKIGGPILNGGQGGNNLSGSVMSGGIGSPSPKLVSVLRRTPGGGQITIIVDLNRALTDPQASLLVKAGDILILQQSKGQAIVGYSTGIFNFNMSSILWQTSKSTGTFSASGP